jgi:signal transduction histidine kinase
MKKARLIKILAVDDEPAILKSLRRIFVEEDCVFIAAGSVAEGLELMRLGSVFDIIISDFLMPGMNGLDFLTVAYQLQPHTLRILLTAQAPGKDVVASLKSGVVTTCITKPWDNEQLYSLVKCWIADNNRHIQLKRNATKRKKLEEERVLLKQQIHASQRLESLGVLAGGIAHEFNNILQVIVGGCSLIALDHASAESIVPIIEKVSTRAANVCSKMLAYAGEAPFIKSQVDMLDLVNGVFNELASSISRNLELKPELATNVPPVMGDYNQLSQIVMNLIINAAEAIGDTRGEIRVALTSTTIARDQLERDHLGRIIPYGTYVCLEVADNGCGMNDKTRQQIFEPFYTTKRAGLGLGMSATLCIIMAHGGALQLSSKLGQGSTFKVYLQVQPS